MLLHQKKHQNRWQCSDDGACRNKLPLRHILTVQRVKTRGDGLNAGRGGQHCGPEIFVPDEGEDQNRQGGNGGAHQGDDDVPENLDFRHTFNAGGFNQFERQAFDEVAHEQGTEPGLKGDVKQAKAGRGIDQAKVDGHVADRDHQYLERHKVARNENKEDRHAATEFVDPKREAGHRGQGDNADDDRDRQLERI